MIWTSHNTEENIHYLNGKGKTHPTSTIAFLQLRMVFGNISQVIYWNQAKINSIGSLQAVATWYTHSASMKLVKCWTVWEASRPNSNDCILRLTGNAWDSIISNEVLYAVIEKNSHWGLFFLFPVEYFFWRGYHKWSHLSQPVQKSVWGNSGNIQSYIGGRFSPYNLVNTVFVTTSNPITPSCVAPPALMLF